MIGVLLLAFGCARVPEINKIPNFILGEPSFFPTISAPTDAPIIGGNRVELLFNGAEIFSGDAGRYRNLRMPRALLHAKTMVVDGIWATVGSTNLDNRSFALNQELNLVVHDAAIAGSSKELLRRI